MIAREWTHLDKSTWGDGPWQTEPDKVQWEDPTTKLPCLAVRHPSHGQWCGYVGVPLTHPDYGRGYNDMHDHAPGLTVHGGLTFADQCRETDDPSHGICHLAEPGEPMIWWFGFDCAHAFDLMPGLQAMLNTLRPPLPEPPIPSRYCDLDYVRAQCADLALQLKQRQVCPICDEAPLQIDPKTNESFCPHCAGLAVTPAPRKDVS